MEGQAVPVRLGRADEWVGGWGGDSPYPRNYIEIKVKITPATYRLTGGGGGARL
jgi:hypothetical protein